MIRKFTTEQMEELSQWEGHFGTAIRADWSRALGRDAMSRLCEIWTSVGGLAQNNPNCANCVLRLLKEAGSAYFAQKTAISAPETPKADNDTKKTDKAAKSAKNEQRKTK